MKQYEKERPIPFKKRVIVRFLSGFVRILCGTMRLRIDGDEATQQCLQESNGGIMVTWHGRTLIPINRFRGKRTYYGMISNSRDGDFQAELFRSIGMGVIRGSTGRRGVLATREVLSILSKGNVLLFTPDGPRGPSGKVQPGAVYFAQRTGKPIIPAGLSANPRWLLSTWDSFLIPKPFSKGRWIYGEPLFVAPGEDLEDAARRLEDAMNRLEEEAERAVGAEPLPPK